MELLFEEGFFYLPFQRLVAFDHFPGWAIAFRRRDLVVFFGLDGPNQDQSALLPIFLEHREMGQEEDADVEEIEFMDVMGMPVEIFDVLLLANQ